MNSAQAFELLMTTAIGHIQEGAALTRTMDRNLTQGLGVVLDLSIQAQSGVQDDPATMAALATAARVPDSGALPRSA